MAASLILVGALLVWGQSPAPAHAESGVLAGTAVNGTAENAPLADAEIVLRASHEGSFVTVAEMRTDAAGRFAFSDLPLDAETIYLAGVNRGGVHYPGPRVRLVPGKPEARVRLIAYDAVASPSPLVARRHEISIQPGVGFLEVAESLAIDNPSLAAFVGPEPTDDRPRETLRLALPPGVEKITFDREFHGRNFFIRDGALVTELPWPPGQRELKYVYRVPVEQRWALFSRTLDLPTAYAAIRVAAQSLGPVKCNLQLASRDESGAEPVEFRGKDLPRGASIDVQLGQAPLRFETYARWLACGALAVLVTGALVALRLRQPSRAASATPQPHVFSRRLGKSERRPRATASRPRR